MEPNFEDNDLLARWLDNRLTAEEAKQLKKNKELEALKAVVDDIDTWQVKDFDVEAGLKDLKARKNQRKEEPKVVPLKTKSTNYWVGGIAASFVILMASYFVFNTFFNNQVNISTGVAENKTIKLPSGSTVYLDALSSVSYNKKEWQTDRNIQLKGQALFEVTKGKTFTVQTPNEASVTVLGTKFNINTHQNELSVACYEGKVAVEYHTEKEILTAGQGIFLNNNTLQIEAHQNNQPNWQQGFSKYHQTNLSSIIKDLKKYYTVNIELPKKYENLQFSGVVPHDNLEAALKTLFTPFEIKYQIKNESVVFE